jgi:hypothetical protein
MQAATDGPARVAENRGEVAIVESCEIRNERREEIARGCREIDAGAAESIPGGNALTGVAEGLDE